MAYVIAEPCIGSKDGSCVEVCPVDCIHPAEGEPGHDEVEQLFINPEECIDCDACVEACPVDAVFAQGQLPSEWREYEARNADHYQSAEGGSTARLTFDVGRGGRYSFVTHGSDLSYMWSDREEEHMMETALSRRQMLGLMGVAALSVTGCGSVGSDEEGGDEGGSKALKVGLVIPQAGVYAPLGVDMKAGWDLYLAEHGGKLGGRSVELVVADEGEAPDKGVPAVQRLVQRDDVDVLVGIVNSATALGAKDVVASAKKLLIVSNAGADKLTAGTVPYVWRSSFTNGQIGFAVGQHLATTPEGRKGAYAIAADYAAGNEASAGFKAGLEAGGGKLIDEAATPFGTTQDFQPFLSKVRSSGAGACYCFYAGAEAVAFVKQYQEFGLADRIPLFGSGFLTEGGVLEAQGNAATGVRTALHYSAELDNPANQAFVKSYQAKTGKPPTVYAMQTWDAAALVDQAVKGADALDGDTLAKRLESLGEVADSPRGAWSFEDRSPKQTVYLREVTPKGSGFVNAVEEKLGSFGPAPASA